MQVMRKDLKDRSIGKRVGLAFAAGAIGFVTGYFVFGILALFFGTATAEEYWIEVVLKAVGTGAGFGLMTYLAYIWSGKIMALIAAGAIIIWVVLQVVIGGVFMWSTL
jgi:hypothetical protein